MASLSLNEQGYENFEFRIVTTYVFDARLPALLSVVLNVEVREGDEPPDQREDDPAERERHREYQQDPAPLYVDYRREDVYEKAPAALVDVDSRDVTLAVLADETTLASSRHQTPETLLWNHRQHLAACAAESYCIRFNYHATLCVSAVFAVARCPSVRLTRLCILSRRLKISSNFFLVSVAPSF